MTHSTITSKGQTTIPAEVRGALRLKPGDRVSYKVEGDHAVLRRQPGVESLAGMLNGKLKRRLGSPRQEKAAARRAWAHGASRGVRRARNGKGRK